ncbi:MAG: sugar kinase [Candidatus Gastranaerophilales bacterium]|nr:sugar kinase [Candidatus Gastranaerophilales bacterium]
MSELIDIVCIGESLVELSSNESLTYADTLNKYFGGDTMTTAVAASRLGSKVGYVTLVGNDYLKDFLLDAWNCENLDLSQVKLSKGYNGLYFISRLKDGAKEFAYYRKKSAATCLSEANISKEYIQNSQIVYSTGITQSLSLCAREAVKTAFQAAKINEKQVAYDINYTPGLWDEEEAKEAFEEVLPYIDILFVSLEHDIKKLYSLCSSELAAQYLADKGVSIVVIRERDGSVFIAYNGETVLIPSLEHQPVDTTGSGDAFNGGFMHGLLEGFSPFESARLASVVTSFQVMGIGAIKSIPYKEEVYNKFKSITQ